jgi:hypothetical protein
MAALKFDISGKFRAHLKRLVYQEKVSTSRRTWDRLDIAPIKGDLPGQIWIQLLSKWTYLGKSGYSSSKS